MNNKTLTIGLIIFGLFSVALIARNGDIAWMLLPFLFYLGLGLLQAPPREKVRLSAKRSLGQTHASGVASVEVGLRVENLGAETLQAFIQETVPAGVEVTTGELCQRVTLRAGEATELKYTFAATRGDFSWISIQIVVSDPLNLIETEIALPAEAMIQVRPLIKKFKAIPFRPHNTLHAPGSIPARLGGNGTDFFGVREYHAGDPLRSLDWRLTARHPRKFFTKEFEQEEIAEIGLILDARQDADLTIQGESLFEASLGATASLAETFLHRGDRVSLLVFGGTMLNVFPGYGKTQLHRVMGCLAKAKVGSGQRAFASLDFLPIRMFPSHALIIIISSLTSADGALFQRLRAYGYQALLICPDPLDFASQTLEQDPITQLAIRATRIERCLRLKSITQLHIPVIDWKVRQPLFPLVRNALSRSRGQREQ